ncbi:MAG TPA: hypothetical protein VMS93_07620 [Candidatus Saccharimonadales bacterium]|nr:hypothetical protein [Candidatus Saccharimonadales bacterium]
MHSSPEIAHRGQPFDLDIHLVWGSPTGDEVVLPTWSAHPGFAVLGTSYWVRSSPDQPGGGYALHARLTCRMVGLRVGTLPLDSLSVALVRGNARRTVRIPATAMQILPPVSLRPQAWNALAFGAGVAGLLAGLVLVRRRRPAARPAGPTAEERASARLAALRGAAPCKSRLEELLTFIRAEAVRRYGGSWSGSGEGAFQAWAGGCRAPEVIRERVGALVGHLETRCYVPEDPDAAAWQHWIDETERLWRVEEALSSAGRS